jgi:hypothetical protein
MIPLPLIIFGLIGIITGAVAIALAPLEITIEEDEK